jgi:hypothetical protein
MTDVTPLRPTARRPMSRLHAFMLALALILGGVAIARADRPAGLDLPDTVAASS